MAAIALGEVEQKAIDDLGLHRIDTSELTIDRVSARERFTFVRDGIREVGHRDLKRIAELLSRRPGLRYASQPMQTRISRPSAAMKRAACSISTIAHGTTFDQLERPFGSCKLGRPFRVCGPQ